MNLMSMFLTNIYLFFPVSLGSVLLISYFYFSPYPKLNTYKYSLNQSNRIEGLSICSMVGY